MLPFWIMAGIDTIPSHELLAQLRWDLTAHWCKNEQYNIQWSSQIHGRHAITSFKHDPDLSDLILTGIGLVRQKIHIVKQLHMT